MQGEGSRSPDDDMGLEFEGEYEELKIENYDQNPNHQERDIIAKKGNKQELYDPNLIEELEEVFQSAHDHFVSTFLGGVAKR